MRKRIDSFKFAFNGLNYAIKSEVNMRIHILAAILVIVVGLIVNLTYMEWIIIIVCIAMVWSAEIGNTVIEKYLNVYHPEFNRDIGLIKDMSAAVVLILAIASAIIGLIIFLPKFIYYF